MNDFIKWSVAALVLGFSVRLLDEYDRVLAWQLVFLLLLGVMAIDPQAWRELTRLINLARTRQ